MIICNVIHTVNMCFAGIIMAMFYSGCLEPRFNKRKTFVVTCIYMALLNIFFTGLEVSVVRSLVCFTVIAVYLLSAYKERIIKYIMIFMTENCVVLLADVITSCLWYIGGYYDKLTLGSKAVNSTRVMIEFFMLTVFLNLNFLFLYLRNKIKKITVEYNRTKLIIPFVAWINILILGEAHLFIGVNLHVYFTYIVTIVLFSIIDLMLTVYLIRCICDGEVKMQKLEMLEEENKRNELRYRNMWDRYLYMKKLRHDAANYIQTIEFLQKRDTEKAVEMLDILEKRIKEG